MSNQQPGARRQSSAHCRRTPSMSFCAPRKSSALPREAGLARSWKAKAFRRTPDAEEAISRVRDGDDLNAFGDAFITYAVGARQGF